MVLFCERLVDLNGFESPTVGMDGNRDVDSSTKTPFLNSFSNLFLQRCE